MPNLYAALSKLSFLKRNYSLKFLFIAFLGIHIPLITIVIIVITDSLTFNSTYILIAVLIATLGASALTLYFLNKLLWPLSQAKNALGNYLSDKTVPVLPVHFEDEAGLLLKELQYTIEHLDYLISEKKDVITLLSHDIRTPFNQVMGLSGLILMDTDKESIDKHAASIKEISIRNLMLLNDILKLLKIDHINDTENSLAELTELVANACNHLTPTAKAKSIQIHTNATKAIPVFVNRLLLTEAISNILNNAIKFSHPGGNIEIEMGESQGSAYVRITDNGIGIREEDKSKIFKRFTSAGKMGTAGEHSSGVGLYLSQKIVKQNKGELSVYSEGSNKGSSFTITLPVAGK